MLYRCLYMYKRKHFMDQFMHLYAGSLCKYLPERFASAICINDRYFIMGICMSPNGAAMFYLTVILICILQDQIQRMGSFKADGSPTQNHDRLQHRLPITQHFGQVKKFKSCSFWGLIFLLMHAFSVTNLTLQIKIFKADPSVLHSCTTSSHVLK